MRRLFFIVPVLGFAVLAYVLLHSLTQSAPEVLPSPLVGKKAPQVTLAALDADTQGFGPAELAAGRVTVINVFGSWCVQCRIEAPALAKLANQPGFELYGFAYRDTPQKARAYLAETGGNPYRRIGIASDIGPSLEWGIYGAPETFVVDGKGVIRFKYVGPLTDAAVAKELMPAIRAAQAS
jgi:cytochrome c biogenesis protein CcmG/thiol:disulfide interchange protein DsbE